MNRNDKILFSIIQQRIGKVFFLNYANKNWYCINLQLYKNVIVLICNCTKENWYCIILKLYKKITGKVLFINHTNKKTGNVLFFNYTKKELMRY